MTGQPVATLSGDFEITTAGGVAELTKLGGAMDATTAQMLGQAAKVEKTVAGMVDAGPAVRAMGAMVTAADDMASSVTRSRNRIETSAERMIAQLEREAATYGKTREQIRAMDVETKLLAANENNLTDVANRLRMAHQNLTAVQVRGNSVTGSQRAGLQQLAMNMGDVSTSYAGGAKASMIFAQQSGQVAQAISLMAGESSAFARFLGGPYLIAITAAITLGMALAGASSEVKTKAEQEADALKTVHGAIDALDEATGRLHKSKQQEIADSAAAAKAHLAEALANRQLLAAQLEGFKAGTNAPIGGTVGGGTQFASAVSAQFTAASIAENEATIRKLQDSLGGVGFANAVSKAEAATNKAAAATQAYEAQLARIDAAWERSGKTAHDEALVQQLVTDAMKKRDEATQHARGSASGMADADAMVASATNDVQRAEGNLAKVRAQNAIDLAAHNITTAQATQRLTEARTALYQARDAASDYSKGLRSAAATAREFAKLQEEMNRLNLQPISAQMNKSIEKGWADDWSSTLEQIKAVQKGVSDAAAATVKDAIQDDRDRIAALTDEARSAAGNLSDAWGHVGHSIGDAMVILTEYSQRQAKLDEQRAAAAGDQDKLDRIAHQSATLQLNSLIGLTDATKNLFSTHSAGYKVMEAAEKALTILQLARTAATIGGNAAMAASDTARAGVEQANSLATTAVKAVEAVVNAIRSMPFPLNIAAGAATAAVIAGLGVAAVGGFGGGGNNLPKANDGSGTVLGDSKAQSESIKRSIDMLGDIDTSMLGYSRQMATSLKSIETELGGVANLLVRSGDINGATPQVATGFNSSLTDKAGGMAISSGLGAVAGAFVGGPVGAIIGSVVGGLIGSVVKGLFGTKTSVVGSGLYGANQSIGSIESGGYDLQTYADIQKKHKIFGITTGTNYSTQYGAADPQLGQQFALILKSFDDAITAAAGPLGLATDDVTKRLDSFVVSIGKIDFTGLSGTEIQDKLSAVFGAAADKMAEAAVPGLEKFQAVGEGYFETLVRVASTIEQVDSDFKLLGLSAANLGLDAKMGVAGAFNSVDDLNSAVGTYFADFYTDAEQAAAKTAQLSAAFSSLGLKMPTTIDGFRDLVSAQDLTTAAGQQMFATLLQIAPAFADIVTAGQNANSASAILREQQDLEKQLAEAQGDTAAVRQLELAAINPANRAIQEHIYALQDEADAAQKAAQLDQQRASLQQQIWQLSGNTDAIRAAQLAAITDPVSLAMQQQIFAMQDQQAAAAAAEQAAEQAAEAADQLRQAWKSVADSILDEVNTIRGAMVTGPQSYASLLSQFNVATTQARAGDQDAAKALPGLAKSLLDAAAEAATSQQELLRIQGTTASSLEDTYNLINKLSGNAGSAVGAGFGTANTGATEAQASWFAAFQANASGAGVAANDDDIVDQLKALSADNAELRSLLASLFAQLASPLNRVDKNIDKVISAGGGNAFAVAADADDPLTVAVIGTVKTMAA